MLIHRGKRMCKNYCFFFLFFIIYSSMGIAMDVPPPVIRDLALCIKDDECQPLINQSSQEDSTEEEDCCSDKCVCICCPFLWLWIKCIERC